MPKKPTKPLQIIYGHSPSQGILSRSADELTNEKIGGQGDLIRQAIEQMARLMSGQTALSTASTQEKEKGKHK